MQKPSGLSEFLIAEMNKRKLSQREFATLMGIDYSTISKHISGKIAKPSLDFLVRLSEGTHTNLQTVIAFAYPEVADKMKFDPEILLLAERLDRLPEDVKEFILSAAGV